MQVSGTSPGGKTELYASGTAGRPIYARIWRGRTRAAVREAYAAYLYQHGVLEIERMPGNLGVQMLVSEASDTAEFTVVSFWPSLESIRVWSGEDLTRTRHLERDPEFLLELPDRVTLAEVHANDWLLARPETR